MILELFLGSSFAHLLGAVEVFAYNVLLRRAVGAEVAAPVLRASLAFVVISSIAGAVIGRKLTKRAATAPLFYLPLVRAAIGAAMWLFSIPVLAVVAIKTQGHLNPVGFPHFVASVLIACLLSTSYSLTCNLWISLSVRADAPAEKDQRVLRSVLKALPLLALGIPAIAIGMYLFFFRPWTLLAAGRRPLESFLVSMIVLGFYGAIFCGWASRRMLAAAQAPRGEGAVKTKFPA